MLVVCDSHWCLLSVEESVCERMTVVMSYIAF